MKAWIKKLVIGLSFLGIVLSLYLLLYNNGPKEEIFNLPNLSSPKKKEKQDDFIFGGIAIPAINRTLKIYDYNEKQEPYLTDGTMMDVPNRQMGKDNVVLASHDYDSTFGQLINVKNGDMIYTTDEQSIYTFVVTDTYKVTDDNPQEIKKVREDKETPIITLYTCFGGIGTNQRTVVQGEFKEVKSIDSSNQHVRQLFMPQHE